MATWNPEGYNPGWRHREPGDGDGRERRRLVADTRRRAKPLTFALALMVGACHHHPDISVSPALAPPGLAELRQATRPFFNLDAAVAAGYVRSVAACLVHEHHGAMGYHHTNPQYMDAEVDLAKPEILLYERTPSGEYRLNGVEFIVPYRSWPRDSTPPRVMGQPMFREENLKFWYLHAWAWNTNPDGLFANFHPDVRCPSTASKVYQPSGSPQQSRPQPPENHR